MTADSGSPPGVCRRTFLVGGARSGKSGLGQRLAEQWSGPVTAVVTAEPFDAEMAARIERHRNDRPAGWTTVEAPYELETAVSSVQPDTFLLVDCVTVWLSNRMVRGDDDREIQAASNKLVETLLGHDGPLVVVSNEVGFGLVPPDPLSRRFRDAQGRLNQELSAAADRSFLVVAGALLPLTPAGDVFRELR